MNQILPLTVSQPSELVRTGEADVSDIGALAKESWTDPGVFAKRMKLCSVSAREDQLSDLLTADLESKTGLGTVASAVDKFIVRHSAAAETS